MYWHIRVHASAYFSLCDEALPCIVLHVEVVRSLNLNLGQNGLNLYKISKTES
jgi:hypothetical protein